MDRAFMDEAIRLSREMMLKGQGGPFGAVVVRDGEIIGRGYNAVTSSNDPTAHAEIMAIREACRNLDAFRLSGCEIYTSCEPCPMCLAAIYWARIDRIYFANTSDDAGAAGFDDARFYEEMALKIDKRKVIMRQIMRDEAIVAFREWEELPDKIKY